MSVPRDGSGQEPGNDGDVVRIEVFLGASVRIGPSADISGFPGGLEKTDKAEPLRGFPSAYPDDVAAFIESSGRDTPHQVRASDHGHAAARSKGEKLPGGAGLGQERGSRGMGDQEGRERFHRRWTRLRGLFGPTDQNVRIRAEQAVVEGRILVIHEAPLCGVARLAAALVRGSRWRSRTAHTPLSLAAQWASFAAADIEHRPAAEPPHRSEDPV